METLHSREQMPIPHGPQQKDCHGHPHHSSIKVAVEMRMEGVELLLLLPEELAVLLLEEAADALVFSPEEPDVEGRRHSLVWCMQKHLCFLRHQQVLPSTTLVLLASTKGLPGHLVIQAGFSFFPFLFEELPDFPDLEEFVPF